MGGITGNKVQCNVMVHSSLCKSDLLELIVLQCLENRGEESCCAANKEALVLIRKQTQELRVLSIDIAAGTDAFPQVSSLEDHCFE